MVNSFNTDITKSYNGRVLFVGNPDSAFADKHLVEWNFHQCDNMFDAVSLAATEKFSSICVVMSGFSASQLRDALGTIRKTNSQARIVLLAQMNEEPLAREIQLRERTVNDYLICPIEMSMVTGTNLGRITTTQGKYQDQVKSKEIEKLETKIQQLEKLAITDDLTGLRNRRYIREFLYQILKHAKREEMRVTLLVFDIDDFKHYNDEYGHKVGDNVLQQAGAMMLNCCRGHDVVGRIGGDEFAVIFWDRPDSLGLSGTAEKDEKSPSDRRGMTVEHPREPLFMAERFRKAISSAKFHFLGTKGKGLLTISGGLASFPHDGLTVEELFEKADKAMLEAKRSGKNRIDLVGGEY